MAGRGRDGGQRSEAAGASADVLDETLWRILYEAVTAAHHGDAAAFRAAVTRFDTDVPVDGRAATYIWWLLRYRLAEIAGPAPARDDLTRVAGFGALRFRVLVSNPSLLENVLLTVCKLVPPEREVSGGMFVAAGTAALGVLVPDPAAFLDDVRPEMAARWQASQDRFRADGAAREQSADAKQGRQRRWRP